MDRVDRSPETGAAPSRQPRAWYIVGLLTALAVLSFLDRYILALLAAPLAKDLRLSDSQVALVIGLAFAVVYAVGGIPIAQLIDRYRRKPILVVGVLLWSGLTIAAAFAQSFTTLLICRAGVALGEAVLAPAAISLIADLFPHGQRATPTSVFASVTSIMSKGAFLLGAGALAIASMLDPYVRLANWRMALIIVGVPGLFLAILVAFTMREPARIAAPNETRDAGDFAPFVRYLSDNWRLYLPFYVGVMAFGVFAIAAVSWVPSLLGRGFALEPATAGLWIGVIGSISGFLGTFFWPWLAGRFVRAGKHGAIFIAMALAGAVLIFGAGLGYANASLAVVLAGLAVAQFATSAGAAMPPLAIQAFGPPRMRAKLTSLNQIAIHLIGSSLGPLAVAWLALGWPGAPRALGYGLAALGVVTGMVGSLSLVWASRAARTLSQPGVAMTPAPQSI